MLKHITPLILLFSLIACSTSEDNDKPRESQNTKNQTSTKKHMLSDQQRMIQKAKDTEKLIKDTAEKQKKAVDDASK